MILCPHLMHETTYKCLLVSDLKARAAAPREVRREEDVLEEAREEGEGEEFLFKSVLTSFQLLKANAISGAPPILMGCWPA